MARQSVSNSPVKTAKKTAKPAKIVEKPARKRAVVAKPPDLGEMAASIAMLSRLTDLDRATVKKRLIHAEIIPLEEHAKETLYKLGEALPALFNGGQKMEEAKIRKTVVEAQMTELTYSQKKKELLPVADFKAAMIDFFRAMDSRLVGTYPTRAAQRIRSAKNARQTIEILQHDMKAILDELRTDLPGFVRRHTGSDTRA